MHPASLVTVTLNPALDLTGTTCTLELGGVNRVGEGHLRAAGKGINVAMVARDLGLAVSATGILGQDNQAPFVELLSDYQIEDSFVREAGETRINVKLAEASGRVTDINFAGFEVSQASFDKLCQQVLRLAEQHQVFVLAGSLPPGLPSSAWASLVALLRNKGKLVILDSSGEALASALNGNTELPSLIKPNEHELSALLGQPCLRRPAQRDAALQLLEKGLEHVVVSNGAAGVSWYQRGCELHAKAPAQQVVSTVGAGDSLVAGLAAGLAQGLEPEQCLRQATAAAALAVTQVGVGLADKSSYQALLEQVELESLATAWA